MTDGAAVEVHRSCAQVDLAAIRENTAVVRDAAGVPVMAVVKADGYGHGLVAAARAALEGGASWLGTALVEEALELRRAGIRDVPVLAWLLGPHEDWDAALRHDVQLSVSTPGTLGHVAAAARRAERRARVHLEADSGMSRGGATAADWPALVQAARRAEFEGSVEVVGLWAHFACADEPEHPANARQLERFVAMVAEAREAGLRPQVLHHANSPAALLLPAARFDLVRAGIALYGVSPAPELGDAGSFRLRGAMTLRSLLTQVKEVPAGEGVSYGHSEVTSSDTLLGVVPLGYADGIPRHASGTAEVLVRTGSGSGRARLVGRVCMDQVVVDLGGAELWDATAGDQVVVLGDGRRGEPTADDWARWAGTIGYEVVSRIGSRVPRAYVGGGGRTP